MRDKGILGLYEAYLEVYTHQEEVEQLDEGYQRNPEKDPDYVPPGKRPTRRQRMNDPHIGINSPAFHAFMAQQTGGGKKKKKGGNENVNSSYEYDAFDAILEHLVAEGYADTNQAALAIMANMSEEWRESIIEEVLDEELTGERRKRAEAKITSLGRKKSTLPSREALFKVAYGKEGTGLPSGGQPGGRKAPVKRGGGGTKGQAKVSGSGGDDMDRGYGNRAAERAGRG